MGLLYVFNLIVGTGALALPRAFQRAGYILSIVVLSISCVASYVAATFVVEALAIGNAAQRRKRKQTSCLGVRRERHELGTCKFQ
ncbi:hypothetical protein ANCDUO_18277 [Ancylostoma duodenale]|uniref:Amino acid transporter transmembrane domain-containing protein n=1 Tax=Ancylostoma duodenale TaxID=51022 RepID=A0A0C2FSS1_9BILA|nr:hypothetical protein ANCDUO_18277 [Ancylostoma duodenale]